MGDRTTTNTTIAACDLQAVRALLLGDDRPAHRQRFTDETPNGDGTITVTQYDVNWGGEHDAEALARSGIPFVIRHDAGGSYEAGWIVFDGTTRASMYGSDGKLLIAFDEATGEPDAEDIARARDFVALKTRAEAAVQQRALAAKLRKEGRERERE